MEFWGVEIKAGQSHTVEIEEGSVLHLSQASLGEVDKDKGSAILHVTVNGKKIVIGTLVPEKSTQITYDLVFNKQVTFAHSWKSGSVYFCGYKADSGGDDGLDFSDSSEEEDEDSESDEEQPKLPIANGNKPEPKAELAKSGNKANASKPESAAPKSKVKIAEPKKNDKAKESEDDDSSDEDDDGLDDTADSDEDLDDSDDGSSDDDDAEEDSSEEEDEATPKKVESGKKRSAESGTKTPVAEKKAKLVTPQKSGGDGKKGGGHTATPHPKKAGKNAANESAEKSKQTPKSSGQVSCKTCSKTFNSDSALQSHTKAKHSAGK